MCAAATSPIGNVTKRKTHKEFTEEVFQLVGEEYSVLSRYINSLTKVKLKHNKCGHEWFVTPSSFTSTGSRCPKCAILITNKKIKLTQKEFESRVKKIHGSNYVVIGEYEHSEKKLTVKHVVCNTKYKVRPKTILNGRGCPNCNLSKGERDIKLFLDNNMIDYKEQYKINECRNIYPLPFDFAIFDNGKLICLIEYDGRQHFESVEYWGGEKEFELSKRRDKIKRDYCQQNKIPLIEIPYWNYKNINKILETKLLRKLLN